jgi:hypothetical protein
MKRRNEEELLIMVCLCLALLCAILIGKYLSTRDKVISLKKQVIQLELDKAACWDKCEKNEPGR